MTKRDTTEREGALAASGAAAALVAFSPDGRLLAVGSDKGSLDLYDVATGARTAVLKAGEQDERDFVTALAFSPDGSTLAAVGPGPAVRLWRCGGGIDAAYRVTEEAPQAHTGRAFALAFSPDGRTLATDGTDKTIRLWDVVTGRETLDFRHELPNKPGCLRFTPDGLSLIAVDEARQVRRWTASRGGREIR